MKGKAFKRLSALFMVALLVCCVFRPGFAYAADTVTCTNAAQVAQLVSDGYNNGEKGPITITKGTLQTGSGSKTVYLVTLSGTELVFNQSTEYLTDLFSGFNLKSAYYYNVVKVIKANVPKGSNLILAGHSLGGMIGVISGIILAEVISRVSGTPVAISVPSIILSVLFSMMIGVIFGFLPSVQAANLNPIDALRRE